MDNSEIFVVEKVGGSVTVTHRYATGSFLAPVISEPLTLLANATGANVKGKARDSSDSTAADSGSTDWIYQIWHGALMVAAWVLFAPLSIVVARYFKSKLGIWWFRSHIIFALLGAFGCTVAGFGLALYVTRPDGHFEIDSALGGTHRDADVFSSGWYYALGAWMVVVFALMGVLEAKVSAENHVQVGPEKNGFVGEKARKDVGCWIVLSTKSCDRDSRTFDSTCPTRYRKMKSRTASNLPPPPPPPPPPPSGFASPPPPPPIQTSSAPPAAPRKKWPTVEVPPPPPPQPQPVIEETYYPEEQPSEEPYPQEDQTPYVDETADQPQEETGYNPFEVDEEVQEPPAHGYEQQDSVPDYYPSSTTVAPPPVEEYYEDQEKKKGGGSKWKKSKGDLQKPKKGKQEKAKKDESQIDIPEEDEAEGGVKDVQTKQQKRPHCRCNKWVAIGVTVFVVAAAIVGVCLFFLYFLVSLSTRVISFQSTADDATSFVVQQNVNATFAVGAAVVGGGQASTESGASVKVILKSFSICESLIINSFGVSSPTNCINLYTNPAQTDVDKSTLGGILESIAKSTADLLTQQWCDVLADADLFTRLESRTNLNGAFTRKYSFVWVTWSRVARVRASVPVSISANQSAWTFNNDPTSPSAYTTWVRSVKPLVPVDALTVVDDAPPGVFSSATARALDFTVDALGAEYTYSDTPLGGQASDVPDESVVPLQRGEGWYRLLAPWEVSSRDVFNRAGWSVAVVVEKESAVIGTVGLQNYYTNLRDGTGAGLYVQMPTFSVVPYRPMTDILVRERYVINVPSTNATLLLTLYSTLNSKAPKDPSSLEIKFASLVPQFVTPTAVSSLFSFPRSNPPGTAAGFMPPEAPKIYSKIQRTISTFDFVDYRGRGILLGFRRVLIQGSSGLQDIAAGMNRSAAFVVGRGGPQGSVRVDSVVVRCTTWVGWPGCDPSSGDMAMSQALLDITTISNLDQ
ncbi:hypothetical protein BJ742DRAFT_855499 [Cladochytrium replicatum]|nr:hypothetical protein BJ742DRAFT_855499 [Cladochytrium replicatum]